MEKIKLWKDPEKKLVDPLLFSAGAEKLAKRIGADNEKMRSLNKRTQLRKFYDEVVRLAGLSKSRPDEWPHILPMVHMLTAKAAYADGRKLISSNFRDFISGSVEQIHTPEDLNLFSSFFEAFMGFYRLHGPSN